MKVLSRLFYKTDVNRVVPSMPQLPQGGDVVQLSQKVLKDGFFKIKFLLGFTKAQVKMLDKAPLNEFFAESQRIMIKSLGIPQDFSPPLIPVELDKKIGMLYDGSNNVIYANKSILGKNRALLFSLHRHELEHCRQNMLILCTEGLGDRAVRKYTELLAKNQINAFVLTYKNMPEAELLKLKETGQIPEISLVAIDKLRKAAQEGDSAVEVFAEEQYKQDLPEYLKIWENKRKELVETKGVVKAGTREARDAEIFYKSAISSSVSDIGGLKYYSDSSEACAYLSGSSAFYEYLLRRFI